ncbi:hypothetical protein HU230_0011575 [Bradyrhizobium quebecense]|uniref:Uncharacterized protein n=1 Tax=Bradyrhizobium quebecense TaxID=2748629 RepID=A0A973WNF5_9BRAD|nr:hypothetical protein [Bradyrhizobium quebecense]UGA46635.1 hypothetical protein HU230_0011575 [Bradyrhizobium quebecense]
MNNSQGHALEVGTLAMFDRLPTPARRAIAGARFDWALGEWLSDWTAGKISARGLAVKIQAVDKVASASERAATWGPDYPILKGELP